MDPDGHLAKHFPEMWNLYHANYPTLLTIVGKKRAGRAAELIFIWSDVWIKPLEMLYNVKKSDGWVTRKHLSRGASHGWQDTGAQPNTLHCPIHRVPWSVVLKATSSWPVSGTEPLTVWMQWPEMGMRIPSVSFSAIMLRFGLGTKMVWLGSGKHGHGYNNKHVIEVMEPLWSRWKITAMATNGLLLVILGHFLGNNWCCCSSQDTILKCKKGHLWF